MFLLLLVLPHLHLSLYYFSPLLASILSSLSIFLVLFLSSPLFSPYSFTVLLSQFFLISSTSTRPLLFLEPSCLPLLCYSFLIFFTSTRPHLILLDHPVCLSFVTLPLLPLVCILLFFLISPLFVYNLTLSFFFPYSPRFSPSVHFSRISNISCSFLLSSPSFSSYPSTILPLTPSFYILLFYSSFSHSWSIQHYIFLRFSSPLCGFSSINLFLLSFSLSFLSPHLFFSSCLSILLPLSHPLLIFFSSSHRPLILEPSYHCLFVILPSLRDFSFQSIFVPLLFSFHFSPLLCILLAPLAT